MTTGWAAIAPPIILILYVTHKAYKAENKASTALYFKHLIQIILGYALFCLLVYGVIYLHDH
jgi:hypothetical protein